MENNRTLLLLIAALLFIIVLILLPFWVTKIILYVLAGLAGLVVLYVVAYSWDEILDFFVKKLMPILVWGGILYVCINYFSS